MYLKVDLSLEFMELLVVDIAVVESSRMDEVLGLIVVKFLDNFGART